MDAWFGRHRSLLGRLSAAVPVNAVLEAVAVDMARRRASLAPMRPGWQPSAEDAATLATRTLMFADHVTLLHERWPLVTTRLALMGNTGCERVPLCAPAERHWEILRTNKGFAQIRLQPRQAMLYRERTRRPLQEAIAKRQRSVQPRERDAVAGNVQQWFAQGVALGLWRGVRD